MTLKERIRELCIQKGINLPKLEDALGFGNGTIVKWDKSSPSLGKVVQVAEYFGITVSELLNEDIEPVTNPLYLKVWDRAKSVGFESIAELCRAARIRQHDFYDLRYGRTTSFSEHSIEALAPVLGVDHDFFLPYNVNEQKNKPTTEIGDELYPGADSLTEENKAKVREYIQLLLNAQRSE